MEEKWFKGFLGEFSRQFGIFLVLAGAFIVIMQPFSGVTGAVIDLSTTPAKVWFFVGLGMVIVGATILFMGKGPLDSKVSQNFVPAPEFFARIDKKEPNPKKRYLILDTSAILLYTPEQMERKLQEYENVFVPDRVLGEIKDEKMRKIIEEHSTEVEGFEEYRRIARRYLQRTEKPQIRRIIHPYLIGKKQLTHRDQQEISQKSGRLRRILAQEDGLDSTSAQMLPEYALGKVKEQLRDHCRVSSTDVDGLATAMKVADLGYHAIIGEKDIDFRQAIELIKKEKPKLGNNIDFVEPYKREYRSAN